MQVGNSICVLVYASEFSLMEMYLLPIFLQVFAKLLQSCPTLCDPMDCSPPGSSAHGVIQARILEWVTKPSSRGSSWPRDQTHFSYVFCIGRQVLYPSRLLGSPRSVYLFVNNRNIVLDFYINSWLRSVGQRVSNMMLVWGVIAI